MHPDRRERALRIDQDPAALGVRFGGAARERPARLGTAAAVDDDGAELLQDRLEQWKALEMIAGDEGEIVELGVDAETIAIGGVLGRQDEAAWRQALGSAHFDPDSGDHPHGPDHPAHVAADHVADPPAPRRERRQRRPESVEDRDQAKGDVEDQTAHGFLTYQQLDSA